MTHKISHMTHQNISRGSLNVIMLNQHETSHMTHENVSHDSPNLTRLTTQLTHHDSSNTYNSPKQLTYNSPYDSQKTYIFTRVITKTRYFHQAMLSHSFSLLTQKLVLCIKVKKIVYSSDAVIKLTFWEFRICIFCLKKIDMRNFVVLLFNYDIAQIQIKKTWNNIHITEWTDIRDEFHI